MSGSESQVSGFFLRQLAPSVQQGYLEFRTIYVGQVPIPKCTSDECAAMESLVRKLLAAGGQGPEIEVWERELNALVYEVYGLTHEEIAIVEGQG